eukprot:COSAG06_NODE_1307_length_9916_cov_99.462361_11_plen_65_part_00
MPAAVREKEKRNAFFTPFSRLFTPFLKKRRCLKLSFWIDNDDIICVPRWALAEKKLRKRACLGK